MTTEVINFKKRLTEELQDLEKHKKLFFIGNSSTFINVDNKPDVVVKYNFDESAANTNANDYSVSIDKSFKIINNSNYNIKENSNNITKYENSPYDSGSNNQKNRSIQPYPKVISNRSSSNVNQKPPHPEIKLTLTKKI